MDDKATIKMDNNPTNNMHQQSNKSHNDDNDRKNVAQKRCGNDDNSSSITTTSTSTNARERVYRRCDLIAFELLDEPIWIFDIERKSMWWANEAAYEQIWNCTSLTELLQRDYEHDMSDSTRRRLDDNLAKYNNNEKTYATWTFYPNGGINTPKTCFIAGSGIRIIDDDENDAVPRMAMLNEAYLKEKNETLINETTLRELEMLRHLPVAVGQFDASTGRIINQNPESLHLFTNTNNNKSSCTASSCIKKTNAAATTTTTAAAESLVGGCGVAEEPPRQHDVDNDYDHDDRPTALVVDRQFQSQAEIQAHAHAQAQAQALLQARHAYTTKKDHHNLEGHADVADQNQQHDYCRGASLGTATTARKSPTASFPLSSLHSSSSSSDSPSYNNWNHNDSQQVEEVGDEGEVGYNDSKSTIMTTTTATIDTTTTLSTGGDEGSEGRTMEYDSSSCRDVIHDVGHQPRQPSSFLPTPKVAAYPALPAPSGTDHDSNKDTTNSNSNFAPGTASPLVVPSPDLSMFVDRFVDRDLGRYILNEMRRSTSTTPTSDDNASNINFNNSNNNNVDDYQVDAQQYTADGSIRWFSIRVRRRRDPITGQHIILYSARDITDVVMAKHEATIADQQNMEKSEFLAVMAHEIRTPLHQVIGFIELLAQTSLSDEQTEYVNLLQNSTVSLMSVINDTLDYTKLEAGQMQLEKIEFDIRDVCEGSIMAIEHKAHDKGLQTKINVSDDDIPTMIYGDPNRLRQILLNLLHNAVKFTHEPSGSVSLVVTRHYPDNDAQGRAILDFVVEDTGIGINEQHKQRIFDKYHQANSSVSRTYGGTGLGLTISKILTETMDGTISVESEVGKGSRFTIQIPFEVVNNDDDHHLHDKQQQNDNANSMLLDEKDYSNRRDNMNNSKVSKTSCLSSSSSFSSSLAGITSVHPPCNTGDVINDSNNGEDDISDRSNIDHLRHRNDDNDSSSDDDCCTAMMKSNNSNKNASNRNNCKTKWKKEQQQEMKKLNILVVEDNKVNQKMAVAMLRRMGHHAIVVENGLEAVQYVVNNVNSRKNDDDGSSNYRYNEVKSAHHDDHLYDEGNTDDATALDLILMDIQMPVMDGIEATKEIRKLGYLDIPIVGLTADFRKADLSKKYLSIGMNDCIGKPMRMNRLHIAMENATTRVINNNNIHSNNMMMTAARTTTSSSSTSTTTRNQQRQ